MLIMLTAIAACLYDAQNNQKDDLDGYRKNYHKSVAFKPFRLTLDQ